MTATDALAAGARGGETKARDARYGRYLGTTRIDGGDAPRIAAWGDGPHGHVDMSSGMRMRQGWCRPESPKDQGGWLKNVCGTHTKIKSSLVTPPVVSRSTVV